MTAPTIHGMALRAPAAIQVTRRAASASRKEPARFRVITPRAVAPPRPTVRSPATRPRAPARPLLFAQIPAKRPRAPAPAPRPAPTSFTRRKANARFITTLGVTGPGATASGLLASGRRNIPGPPPATAHGPAASLIAATAVVRVPAI